MVFASLPWREYNKKIFFERDNLRCERPLLCYGGQTIPAIKHIMNSFIPTEAVVKDHGIAFSDKNPDLTTGACEDHFMWVPAGHPKYDKFLQLAEKVNGREA